MDDIDLTPEQWEALRQLSLGPARLPIAEAHADKFVALGLARHVEGGYEITAAGLDVVEAHYTH
jgi:hypothetical protein